MVSEVRCRDVPSSVGIFRDVKSTFGAMGEGQAKLFGSSKRGHALAFPVLASLKEFQCRHTESYTHCKMSNKSVCSSSWSFVSEYFLTNT